jgi:hypothetical protein
MTRGPTDPVFVRGNEKIDALLRRPDIAAEVAQVRETSTEMNRLYAMNLAMVRKAAQLTQVELARNLGMARARLGGVARALKVRLSGSPPLAALTSTLVTSPPASRSSASMADRSKGASSTGRR